MKIGRKRRKTDWDEVRNRIEEAASKLEGGWTPTSGAAADVLRRRAADLARERPGKEAPQETIDVIEFLLAGERYAIESSYVKEVCPLKDITPLPGTPGFVAGIVNVRGRILSVLDLRTFFDLPGKGLGDLNRIIVLQSPDMAFGVLADAIVGTRTLSLSGIQPVLPTLTDIREAFLKGVTGERVVVLEAGKLLSDKRIIVNDQI